MKLRKYRDIFCSFGKIFCKKIKKLRRITSLGEVSGKIRKKPNRHVGSILYSRGDLALTFLDLLPSEWVKIGSKSAKTSMQQRIWKL
jgi:hypothetical protein